LLLGALATVAIIMAVEGLSAKLFPLPLGVDPRNPESLKAVMAHMPAGALLLVAAGWFLGTFAGAWVAARIAGRAPLVHGLILGVLFLAGAIANLLAIPHPVWFWVLSVALFLPAAYLGAKLATGRPGQGSSLAPA
jgi:hypothetical protein